MIPWRAGEPLTCQQMRELDVLAIEHLGIPGLILMENAARGVTEVVYGLLPDPARARVVVLCGPGNNGGDGLTVARQLLGADVSAVAVLAVESRRLAGDAAANLAIYQRIEGNLLDASTDAGLGRAEECLRSADVVVDALLGTGARGEPEGRIADLVRLANDAPRARRVAIDIPTGLDGDTGNASDPCFQADVTVTFVAEKLGFRESSAARVLGRVVIVDIGIPPKFVPGRDKSAQRA